MMWQSHLSSPRTCAISTLPHSPAQHLQAGLVTCRRALLRPCRLAGYELHDLVALDNQTFGVIVGVEKEACRVLTNQGRPEKPDVRVCRLPDIQRKLLARRNVTQDAGGWVGWAGGWFPDMLGG